MRRRHSTFLLALGTMVSAGLFTGAAGALFGGCKARPCTSTSLDPNEPSPALECPSGQLCYQGACILGCSAGQERATTCGSNSDCSGALPNCVDGFCSACDLGEVCIPTLNICEAVVQVPLPDQPAKPMPGLPPPYPLDGGPLDGASYLDGGLSRIVDAGINEPPPEAEVTHVGFVDLAQEEDFRAGAPPVRRVGALINGWDVRGYGPGIKWRADFEPPVVQCRNDDEDRDGCGARETYAFEQCVIRPLRVVTSTLTATPAPANLGDVRVDSHPDFPASINAVVLGAFDPAVPGYVLSPPVAALPQDLLVFSGANFENHYLTTSGTGNPAITAGAWPSGTGGAFLGHHVPYRLEPSQATLTLLATRPVVTSPASQDLFLQWDRVDTGDDAFERVVVRMVGAGNELFCDAIEGQNGDDTIELPAATLNEWRRREGPGTYALYFERASAQRLPITGQTGLLVDVTVRVRHTLVGELDFQ
jgi:hypothetical protein